MKEAYWGYWLVVLGVFIIVVLLLVQSFTSSNTQDYYLVKTITEAAMEDAVDFAYYRNYGELKINKEKFYESFLRRFAEEASLATTYDIEFTEVYEAPPKVGVKVSSKSNTFNIASDSESFDLVNRIDAILEIERNEDAIADDPVQYCEDGYAYFDTYHIKNPDIEDSLKGKTFEVDFGDDDEHCNGLVSEITIIGCGYEFEGDTEITCVAHAVANNKCILVAPPSTYLYSYLKTEE